MTAYYNENNPFAARWLSNLIKAGHITLGDVDERSIEDVTPNEIKSYTQCHFFAGIGGWSLALRQAGWPDDRPIWTGSAPCQPFSGAGKGGGFADERHLWPALLWLISQRQPPVIFGEQVASKGGRDWFDVVSSDLEAHGYAVGAADLCAASVGAPHRRQRLYFVADAQSEGKRQISIRSRRQERHETANAEWGGRPGVVADANRQGLEERRRQPGNNEEELTAVERTGCESGELDDTISNGRGTRWGKRDNGKYDRQQLDTNVCNGFWSNAEWIPCLDGKARPVEPGVPPLAHGVSARVGRLRGYGNAIVTPLAAEFIRAYMEA